MPLTEKMCNLKDSDFATMLKLMLKLGGTIITTQSPDDFQCIYAVGSRETVMYKFDGYGLYDRAIKPYGSNPTMCTSRVKDLIAELLTIEGLTITVHT